MMTVGSLFAGIGGFDLAFERAGYEIRWQVEIDPYASAVLAKHWPHVTRYADIKNVRGADVEPVDVLCGGFPCQDISVAGKGVGIDGARSGLWSEFDRLIGELRPRYVVVENVSALLARGFSRVLGDLATRGYDAEWDCLPASAFGAPHQRDRVWIVAYSNESGRRTPKPNISQGWPAVRAIDVGAEMAYSASGTRQLETSREGGHTALGGEDVADANHARPQGRHGEVLSECAGEWATRPSSSSRAHPNADSSDEYRRRCDVQMGRIWRSRSTPTDVYRDGTQWRTEPNVGRVAHGISSRVDRLKGLGNAIVPQVAEWIARRITEAEAS